MTDEHGPNDSHNQDQSHGGGVTQSIRAKLNFLDDRKWRRFSARRLELIDSLGLSNRKASEQYNMITYVANELRKEYQFPEENMDDFDKLVRAAIQSVRRNRKRSKMTQKPGTKDEEMASSSSSPSARSVSLTIPKVDIIKNSHERISITNLVGQTASSSPSPSQRLPSLSQAFSENLPSGSNYLPPMVNLTLNSSSGNNRALVGALEHLQMFSKRVRNGPVVKHFADPGPTTDTFDEAVLDNREFLGLGIVKSSVATCIEKIPELAGDEVKIRMVRDAMLSPTVTNALAKSIGMINAQQLMGVSGECCIEFGFDAYINCLRNVYAGLFELDRSLDYGSPDISDRLAILFTLHRTEREEIYPPSAPSTVSTSMPSKPRIRPVLLRFMDQKLELTYEPKETGPPTLTEVLENARQAFQISEKRVLLIRDVNRGGKTLENDVEISEAFSGAKVDLELTYPTQLSFQRI